MSRHIHIDPDVYARVTVTDDDLGPSRRDGLADLLLNPTEEPPE